MKLQNKYALYFILIIFSVVGILAAFYFFSFIHKEGSHKKSNSFLTNGDYNGDGKTEIAIYHVPSNQWIWRDKNGTPNFLGQYGWGGLQSFPIPGDYDGDGAMEIAIYRPSENRWFIRGEPDFVWGWDGANFMPITSQMAIYNWFRFVLGRFQ
jgi:hypothetical protein